MLVIGNRLAESDDDTLADYQTLPHFNQEVLVRIHLKYLCLLSVQQRCQIKTNNSGETTPNREVDGH